MTENYLHFYLGCDVVVESGAGASNQLSGSFAGPFKLVAVEMFEDAVQIRLDGYQLQPGDVVKPVLRPLNSITEDEATKSGWMGLFTLQHFAEKKLYRPDAVPFLLSKCFDLFNLIETGAAINREQL